MDWPELIDVYRAYCDECGQAGVEPLAPSAVAEFLGALGLPLTYCWPAESWQPH